MIIRRAEILVIGIPFRFTFRHALAARSVGENVLVRLESDAGVVGFGECAPRGYVTGETPESVVEALRVRWLPRIVGVRIASLEAATGMLGEYAVRLPRSEHAAFCAFELALLDVVARTAGRSAGEILGPVRRDHVRYSGVVSSDEVDLARRTCEMLTQLRVGAVKIKVGRALADDCRVLESARTTLGSECSIRIDANGAWLPEQALAAIAAFAPYGVESVEQPVTPEDLAGLAYVTARSPIPVLADESLASFEDAERLASLRACHGFNIRISKCGGLINSARIARVAGDSGLSCMLGAQVGETAVLSAAGRQFATRIDGLLQLEGSYGTILLERDVGRQDLTIPPGGVAPAITTPGLGVDVDPAAVEPYVHARVRIGSD